MGNRRFSRGRRSSSDRAAFLSELTGPSARQRGGPDHKTAMLCRQVQRILSLALDGDLVELSVGDVTPAPNAGHLLVELIVPPDVGGSIVELMSRVEAASPRLRHAVAQSISRKRAPSLSFVPVAANGGAR